MGKKFTTEERKHLVTRTFTEHKISVMCADIENQSFPIREYQVAGNFTDEELMNYVQSKFRTATLIPVKMIEHLEIERKYAMFDYDFIKNGFLLEDEG